MRYFLGIDTSCYTTSVAIMDDRGILAAEARKLLTVKQGDKGLAQSEMVYQHTRNLPWVFEQALSQLEKPVQFAAIGVSGYPRPLPDSYMPAFLVGDGYAKVMALSQRIPLYRISHQENHIFAGIWSAGGPHIAEFLAVHVSGGTTEIVKVTRADQLSINLLGGSRDLHAGQFIDRIGVAMGLAFPAGPELEKLAQSGLANAADLPVAVSKTMVSFSGPETHALRLLAQGADLHELAAGVETCVAETIFRMIRAAIDQTGLKDVLIVGGVMSNQFIRDYISNKLTRKQKACLNFPQAKFSSDNAAGAAYFAFINGTLNTATAYDA